MRLPKLIRDWIERVRAPTRGSLGMRGEKLAEHTLRQKGMRIVGRQVRTPYGEIDIVASDRGTWVFVEVKTRRSDSIDDALEAVTLEKQRRLTRLALAYLKRRDLLDQPARFDVVGISWPTDSQPPEIRHIANAFEPTGVDGMFS